MTVRVKHSQGHPTKNFFNFFLVTQTQGYQRRSVSTVAVFCVHLCFSSALPRLGCMLCGVSVHERVLIVGSGSPGVQRVVAVNLRGRPVDPVQPNFTHAHCLRILGEVPYSLFDLFLDSVLQNTLLPEPPVPASALRPRAALQKLPKPIVVEGVFQKLQTLPDRPGDSCVFRPRAQIIHVAGVAARESEEQARVCEDEQFFWSFLLADARGYPAEQGHAGALDWSWACLVAL
mmetsp:Transcript_47947/g.94609  ORF Transcript_47947/g.94609 Transcript_47947/m.94609 type:complete len:232 (+) Transcript_47947:73-768(+)